MFVPDPVDTRLLALVAEVGRVAVHDLARRAGMDGREVAARLAGLAASGLPLVVGVECDPTALRYVLNTWAQTTPYVPYHGGGPYGPAPGYWPPDPAAQPGPPAPPGLPAPPGPGPVPGQGWPPGRPGPAAAGHHGEPAATPAYRPDTWGPPVSAAWARGDDPDPATAHDPPAGQRTGTVGDALHAEGPEGQRLVIRLVEVVDPADFLFTAAGHELPPGERSVLVHTEVTNRGDAPLAELPDVHLVLLDAEGRAVSKAPVQLSSRPPHRLGVLPGQTAVGNTGYVLPAATELAAVRWSATADDEDRAITWRLRPA